MNESVLPQTFVVECNRANSVLQSNTTANKWTTNIPSLQLKRGDAVRINQAFCSSQGVGDLIDITGDNNEARILFEFYVSNDGANDKIHQQSGLYSEGNVDGSKTYKWINCHTYNYRPARLYRFMNTGTYTAKTPEDPEWIEGTIRGLEDSYVPGLFRNPHCINHLSYFSSTAVNVRDYVRLMGREQEYPNGSGKYWTNPFIVFGSADAIQFARHFVKGVAYRFVGEFEQRLVVANKSRRQNVPFIVKRFHLIDNGGTDEVIMECFMGDNRAVFLKENDFYDWKDTINPIDPLYWDKVGCIAGAANLYCYACATKGYESNAADIYNIYPIFDKDELETNSFKNYTEGYGTNIQKLTKQNDGTASITESFNGSDVSRDNNSLVAVEPLKPTGNLLISELKMMSGIRYETFISIALNPATSIITMNSLTGAAGQYAKLVDYEDQHEEWVFLYDETPALAAGQLRMLRGQKGTTATAFSVNSGVFIIWSHAFLCPRIKMYEGDTYLSQTQGTTFNFTTKEYNGGSVYMMNKEPTFTDRDFRNTMLQIISSPIKTDTSMTSSGVGSSQMRYWEKQSWGIHYSYQDVSISKTYFSPSDIGDEITKQLHDIISIPKNNDVSQSYDNSKGMGIPQSKLLIPVISPSRTTHISTHNYNTLNGDTGMIEGVYNINDFCCKIYDSKGLTKPSSEVVGTATQSSNEMTLTSTSATYAHIGEWWWIESTAGASKDNNGYFRVKAVQSDKIFDVYGTISQITAWKGMPSSHPHIDETTNDGEYYLWFRNRHTPIFNKEWTSVACKNTMKVESAPTDERLDSPYPVLYYDNDTTKHSYINTGDKEYVAQMIGSSNPTLNWNTTINRFEWSNLHQPYISTFTPAGTGTGGTPSCRIWMPSQKGLDNIVKIGGVNIINWAIKKMTTDEFVPADTGWENPLNKLNIDGAEFWETLGFSEDWIAKYQGHTYYDTTLNRGYRPLGTTRQNVDSGEGLIQTTVPTEDDPKEGGVNDGAIGGEDVVGHDRNYGIPNTSGTPAITSTTSPKRYNPDQNIRRSYEVLVDSNTIPADLLPIKTKVPYFLITSSIVNQAEFYGPKGNVAVMGILSKNYQNSDFFFSFQSPITYYIRKDRMISSITTTILKPDLTTPTNISLYSSVIYEIMREPQQPTPIGMPIYEEQALDYQIANQMGGDAQYLQPQDAVLTALNQLNPTGLGKVSFGVPSGIGVGGEPIPTGTMPDLTDEQGQLITPDDPRWERFYMTLANYTQTIEADHLNIVRQMLRSAPPRLISALTGGDETLLDQLRYATATNDAPLVSATYTSVIRPNLFRYGLSQGFNTRESESRIRDAEAQVSSTRLSSMIAEGTGHIEGVAQPLPPEYNPELMRDAIAEVSGTGGEYADYQQILRSDEMEAMRQDLGAREMTHAVEVRQQQQGEARARLTGEPTPSVSAPPHPVERLVAGARGGLLEQIRRRRAEAGDIPAPPPPVKKKKKLRIKLTGDKPTTKTTAIRRSKMGQAIAMKGGGYLPRETIERHESQERVGKSDSAKLKWTNTTERSGFFLPTKANRAKNRVGAHTDGTGWTKPYGWSHEKQTSKMYKRYTRGKGGLYPDKAWIEKHGQKFIDRGISTRRPISTEKRRPPTIGADAVHNNIRPHRPEHTPTNHTRELSRRHYQAHPQPKYKSPQTHEHHGKI